MISHIKLWNHWRKRSLDSKLYKILVLFGIFKSPSMSFIISVKE